jgi:hypothetical protein
MMFEENVKRGMEFLDKVSPGWRERINTESLNIASSRNCILGQIYGSYDDALSLYPGLMLLSRELGFNASIPDCPVLTEAWELALAA